MVDCVGLARHGHVVHGGEVYCAVIWAGRWSDEWFYSALAAKTVPLASVRFNGCDIIGLDLDVLAGNVHEFVKAVLAGGFWQVFGQVLRAVLQGHDRR